MTPAEKSRADILAAMCSCGSGKPRGECCSPVAQGQGGNVARADVTRKLDLACGQTPRVGYEGVDIWPGAQHVVDLRVYPWPFESASVAEINCSHYIEHISMIDVIHDGVVKDALFAFFDECYRILVPDGTMEIRVPSHRSDRAFMDPTHRRFITQNTFGYMNAPWRKTNQLDHYNVSCNFLAEVQPIVLSELGVRHPDVASKLISHEWNRVIDWVAKMRKLPAP